MAEQNNGLEYIEQLLRDGKKQEGRAALLRYVQSHPDSSRAEPEGRRQQSPAFHR